MILEILAAFNSWWFETIVKNGGYVFLILMSITILLTIQRWRLDIKNRKEWDKLNQEDEYEKEERAWKELRDRRRSVY